jgi:ubiquinone/menaquinone biosynthesis C-methylase UbiE
LLAIDRLWGKLRGQVFFRGAGINLENNLNTTVGSKKISNRLTRFLFPTPHGNFSNHRQEFIAFGKKQWEGLFKKAGYVVVAYAKGPAFSGYGFGFRRVSRLLEYLGVSSEHIFVLQKISSFESAARAYTDIFLPRGSEYEKEKFVGDWLKKEKNARSFLRDFTRSIGDPQEKKVLDIGFGNGIMLLEFARAGAISYGLETEETLLLMATKRFRDHNMRAVLMKYDGKSFPFPDNTFNYCYSTSVLEHMSYPEKVLSEIARILVPGGKLYLSFPNKYAPKESHTGLWFISWLPQRLTQYILKIAKSSPLEDWNLHFISYFSFKRMAHKAGLRIVYDTESQSPLRGFIKKVLARFGVHYGALLKTIILVLEKPTIHAET